MVILGAVLLALGVGYFAYEAGFDQGVVQTGKAVPEHGFRDYGWHHWHHGIFFPPFFAIVFWVVVLRMLFGGRCGRRWDRYGDLEDWHSRAHDRMRGDGGMSNK
jgi:hypothetical protein